MPFAVAAGEAGISGRIGEAVSALGAAAEVVRAHGPWVGALLVLAGAAALTAAGRSRHALAVVAGAALGALGALAARGWIAAHVGLSPGAAAALGAAVGAAAGGAWPGAFPLLAGAVPGAILGAGVPLSGRAFLGAAAGAGVGGLAGLAAGRAVGAAVASLLGGALVAIGAVGLLGRSAVAAELTGRPFALAAIAVVLGVAGAAYQVGGGGAPDRGPPLRGKDPPRREPPGG